MADSYLRAGEPFNVGQQMSQECISELISLVLFKITENVCSHFPVSFMGSLLLYRCYVSQAFVSCLSGLRFGCPRWGPSSQKINTSDLTEARWDICISTEWFLFMKITKPTCWPCFRGKRITNVYQTAKWHVSDKHLSKGVDLSFWRRRNGSRGFGQLIT